MAIDAIPELVENGAIAHCETVTVTVIGAAALLVPRVLDGTLAVALLVLSVDHAEVEVVLAIEEELSFAQEVDDLAIPASKSKSPKLRSPKSISRSRTS